MFAGWLGFGARARRQRSSEERNAAVRQWFEVGGSVGTWEGPNIPRRAGRLLRLACVRSWLGKALLLRNT